MRKKDSDALVQLFIVLPIQLAVLLFQGVFHLINDLRKTSEENRKLEKKRIEKKRKLKEKRSLEERKLAEKILSERRKAFMSLVIERSHDVIAAEDKVFINECGKKFHNKSKLDMQKALNSISEVKGEIKTIAQKNNLPKLTSTVETIDRFVSISKHNYTKRVKFLNQRVIHGNVSYLMINKYGFLVEEVTIENVKALKIALKKFSSLKSEIDAYLVQKEEMRVDMIFEKEPRKDDWMSEQIMEEINSTSGYIDDLLKSTKVVFDDDEGIKHEDSARSGGTVSVTEMNRPQFVQRVGVFSVKKTNRKQFVQSVGATCNNWTWSWSFVNEEEKFVLFGCWENLDDKVGSVILKKEWEVGGSGRKAPGYRQALEHLDLVENKGYQLKVFKMIGTNGGSENAKITAIDHHVAERDLKRVGDDWYAATQPVNR